MGVLVSARRNPAMTVPRLTQRPVVSKVGLFERWPRAPIDLHIEEGIVGPSSSSLISSARCAISSPPGAADRARSTAPSDAPRPARRSPALREGKTVMDFRVEFDLTGGAGPPEQGTE